jgi:hypothetical protein
MSLLLDHCHEQEELTTCLHTDALGEFKGAEDKMSIIMMGKGIQSTYSRMNYRPLAWWRSVHVATDITSIASYEELACSHSTQALISW